MEWMQEPPRQEKKRASPVMSTFLLDGKEVGRALHRVVGTSSGLRLSLLPKRISWRKAFRGFE